ncbi:Phage protein [Lactococcus lactis subsp. lactis]|uniref:Phage protein n=1 Tax=Lactococcus lactis subsp. lactis TaxID=1360 RepID=A0A0V8CXV5_LACLL|nr:hypothetical protein [Lactococcus lactis]KSU06056.1 Phage protein [Lactococcus lactis subsp. lactis]
MSEIYIEGRFKMPVFNTDEFGYDDEEVKKFDWEDFAKDEFWNSCDDMGELEDKYDITFHKVQPQLTIPKSIADLLDKFIEFVFEDIGHEEWWIQENGLIEWFSKTPNCYIKDAYLAGKALGVDLVKVVADE